ncbi:hypothetical protein QV09_05490 [Gallibacterium salpingitidis]|uniref:Uncharacterized protein n=1 Tax=Gallibacterium salpingitidis TaxID=505341 RepID=A0AB36E2G9_9PAST|nr:hypothetical protein [Gallibacterium salpingitidis]OBX10405.1 hypothetical protein QV09_05490 [Gallibacterium salpingitidis]
MNEKSEVIVCAAIKFNCESIYKNIIDLIASNCDATIECSKTIGNLIIRLHKKARGLPDDESNGPQNLN